MFPQQTAVIVTDGVPTLLEGDKAGVKRIALGPADNLTLAAAVKGAQQMYCMGDLHGLDVGLDRGAAQLA